MPRQETYKEGREGRAGAKWAVGLASAGAKAPICLCAAANPMSGVALRVALGIYEANRPFPAPALPCLRPASIGHGHGA